MTIKTFGNLEILQVAEAVAREKSINKDTIIEAMEDAMRIAAKRKYGNDKAVKVSINKSTGEIKVYREMLIVEDDYVEPLIDADVEKPREKKRYDNVGRNFFSSEVVDESEAKIILSDAKIKDQSAVVGDYLREFLPPLDLSRLSAQIAKNIITSKVRDIEKEKQFEEFKDRVGEVVSGVVDKIEFGNIIVKLGTADAVLKRDSLLRNDRYRSGDRIKAYLSEINPYARGPQIILSRTNKEFVSKLFAQEVPEIYDHIIEIKAIARDPGSRTKIAVFAQDQSIDPIGSCVGIKGSRVQVVINELNGEKIDIIKWSSDVAKLAISTLDPIEVLKVIVDEDSNRLEVVIEEDYQSAAIGRRGQNVKLISELVNMNVIIMTKDKEAKRRNDELTNVINMFVDHLDLEEILAQLLASEGYMNIADLSKTSIDQLLRIQGLDKEISQELIDRAVEFKNNVVKLFVKELDLSEDLALPLANKGYIDIESISKASPEELATIEGVDKDIAYELIDRINEATHKMRKEKLAAGIASGAGGDKDYNSGDSYNAEAHINRGGKGELGFISAEILELLHDAKITTAAQIADLDNVELQEILTGQGYLCDINIINSIIMSARAIVFK